MTVIRNKDSINLLGWQEVDAITYIFTKGYRSRPDSVKGIPSLKQMEMRTGTWHLDGRPYSGKYMDYYNSGRIQNEGILLEGKLHGTLIIYFQNGHKKSVAHYKNGIMHGVWNDYYTNGMPMQSREYSEGKLKEIWKEYFLNGELRYEKKSSAQTPYDTAFTYYSTGAIKQVTLFRNGTVVPNKKQDDLKSYTTRFYRSLNAADLKDANKFYLKIRKIDSTGADTYYIGGLLMIREFRFDESLAEFNKALSTEPLMMEAFVSRVLARIMKYKYAQQKPLPSNARELAVTLDDFTSMPYDEQLRSCDDIRKARSLGFAETYANKVLPGAILDHCQNMTSF